MDDIDAVRHVNISRLLINSLRCREVKAAAAAAFANAITTTAAVAGASTEKYAEMHWKTTMLLVFEIRLFVWTSLRTSLMTRSAR